MAKCTKTNLQEFVRHEKSGLSMSRIRYIRQDVSRIRYSVSRLRLFHGTVLKSLKIEDGDVTTEPILLSYIAEYLSLIHCHICLVIYILSQNGLQLIYNSFKSLICRPNCTTFYTVFTAVVCNIFSKLKRNLMYRLEAIMFTNTCTHIHQVYNNFLTRCFRKI